MPKAKRRYYSPDDPEHGATPSQLKRMGRERQREYLLFWFARNFEDPAERTTYITAEGGYQWQWGGPYDAMEELDAEFGDFISAERLEAIRDEVESEGLYDWAPGPDHPNMQARHEDWLDDQEPDEPPDLNEIVGRIEAGAQIQLGNFGELMQREEVGKSVARLQNALDELRPQRGGIGHNQPPSDIEADPPPEKATEIEEAATEINTEIAKPQPEPLKVGRAAQALLGALKYLAKKLDTTLEEFLKKLGAGAALALVAKIGFSDVWAKVALAAKDVLDTVTTWLSMITL